MTMTDDLAKRLRDFDPNWDTWEVVEEAADRIEALTAQLESTLRDRKLILEERDRTFALMLARAEKAEADNARLLKALTDARAYLDKGLDKMAFNIIRAALNTGKEPSHE
jgi:hypothetical protein